MSSLPLTASYTGFVGSTEDAVLVIQAVLTKQFPVVERRPLDRERQDLIKLGNVFVFIEESSGIKRWTDGIAWSASRILGRFLVYRELDSTSLSEKDDKRKRRKQSGDSRALHEPYPEHPPPGDFAYRPPYELSQQGFPSAPRLHAPYPYTGYTAREMQPRPAIDDRGLIKKTISITTVTRDLHMDHKDEKQTVHVICYYSAHDVLLGNLLRPSQTNLRHLTVPTTLWDAARRSLLGGKIPMEDEAYYFLDSNYQLQNMSSALKGKPLLASPGKAMPKLPGKYLVMLPVPFAGPAPPISFHADYVPQQLQTLPPRQRSLSLGKELKKEEDGLDYGLTSPFPPAGPPQGTLMYNYPAQYSMEQHSPELVHSEVLQGYHLASRDAVQFSPPLAQTHTHAHHAPPGVHSRAPERVQPSAQLPVQHHDHAWDPTYRGPYSATNPYQMYSSEFPTSAESYNLLAYDSLNNSSYNSVGPSQLLAPGIQKHSQYTSVTAPQGIAMPSERQASVRQRRNTESTEYSGEDYPFLS